MGNKVWVTSDTHFCHANIIGYTDRPFDSVEQMNEVMIDRWNEVVGKNDTLIHVGDFAMGNPALHHSIFDRLNGEKYLIRGNHDNGRTVSLGWADVYKDFRMTTPFGDVYFSHRPLIDEKLKTDLEADGVVLFLHGHCHSKESNAVVENRIDVGVDAWGFQPQRLKNLLERFVV